jgi:oxygen-independent coproporphyrinogen III oxidase
LSRPFGVYIHFPWCRARCPYCDFAIAVAPVADIPHRRYADAVLEELAVRAGRFAGGRLVSIYFGGGTPALWDPVELGRVRAAVASTFADAGADLEVTVEANPLDCTPERLAALRAAGANRLSIGTQAFSDGDLVVLGRDHDARAAESAVAAARAAGFENVSCDLIYALPGRRDFDRSLDRAIALAPEHLSVYQLTIEPGTPFGQAARKGTLVPVPDDESASQFESAHGRLTAAGYEHYEVSAYARPGRRAVHNALYWTGAPYLGLGNGAHSLWTDAALDEGSGIRWSAHRSVGRYLAGAPDFDLARDGRLAEVSPQDAASLAADRLWLGMRTSDGLARAQVPAAALPALLAAGLVSIDAERVRPTPRGLLFADEIGARLLALVQ